MATPEPGAAPTTPKQPTKEERLDIALSRGELDELPANQVRGLLGERNPSLRVVDDLEKPDLNAGISQEMDLPVVWVGILLAYLLFFPLAYVILWRTSYISHRDKVIVSVVGALGLAFVGYWLVIG